MQDPLQELRDQKFALDQSAIVAQTDGRGIIDMVNDKFCEISGYNRDELIGRDHRIVNSGTHPKSFFQQMWQSISKGQVWRGEICNRKKSGELYWVATTITPFLDENRKPFRYLAIRQDITALKLAQQKIFSQEAQLVNASRMSAIGEMAAAVTHEINNPLGVILGRAEMIKNMNSKGQIDAPNLDRLIDTILVTGKRIEKIVRSMKTLSHSHQEDEPFTVCSVKEMVGDAFELCSQRFKNNGIKLVSPTVTDGLQLECHSHQIVQTLVNLLNNSFDAVVGLTDKWVSLEIQSSPTDLHFVITDSGAGIPDELQSKIFSPFFSTKKVQYGTGLGLSISGSIIEKHHGRLFYDSESANTRFVISLPLRQPRPPGGIL